MSKIIKRYNTGFLMVGFINYVHEGIDTPYCLFCRKIYKNSGLNLTILRNHSIKKHSEFIENTALDFEILEASVRNENEKLIVLTPTLKFLYKKISYEVAYIIAKRKKPHNIAEALIKPCILSVVKNLFGDEGVEKINPIRLSDSTIGRRIDMLSADLLDQTIHQLKSAHSGLFAIQLDETTDVSSCAQLMVYVRYIFEEKFREEFLFCAPLLTTTKSADILNEVDSFFRKHGLLWANVCGCCTDGAPAMLGIKSGFQARVREISPQMKGTHCMIHRFALVSKTLPTNLLNVLSSVVKMVNYIKTSALNSRVFKQLCLDLDSEHQGLLYYTEVRWLSKGNMLKRAYDLRGEMKFFFY